VALSVKKGSFAANTATGDQAISSVGFQPKAIMLWGTRLTAAGYGAGIGHFIGSGTSSSERWCSTIFSLDAFTNSETSRRNNSDCIVRYIQVNETQDGQADLVSLDSDGFTINWSDAPASAFIIHYLALGGADITNAKAGFTSVTSGTGDKVFTGVGFQPEFLLLSSNGTSATTAQAQANIHLAAASSTSRVVASSFKDRDLVTTTETGTYQRNDKVFAQIASTSDTVASEGTLASFDSDGFTINYTTGAALAIGYLALRGGSFFVGSDTQKTTTGTEATTGVGFTPKGVFFWSSNQANSSSISSTAKYSIFAADGTTEGGVWFQSLDAAADGTSDMRTVTDKALGFSTQASTTDAEADLSSFDSDGFTLNWTTADATAREFLFAAFGDEPSAVTIRQLATAGVGK
jgi:hypothetical protein